MTMKTKIITGALIAGSLFFASCKKDKDMNGNMSVQLTDAPGNYQQVNVEILKVRVNVDAASGNSGWYDLPTNSGIYNLLALQNGLDTTIVNTAQIPAGNVQQMRLVLGTHNTIMVDSIVQPLDVPSGSESGIKLVGGISVPGNSNVTVLLDFDANQSIVDGGNGNYHLKPVVQVVQ
jgi:hypothetical protein